MCAPAAKLYRPRNPEASPFYKLVRDNLDEFECVYEERFQQQYGYWRSVIRSAIDKFLKRGGIVLIINVNPKWLRRYFDSDGARYIRFLKLCLIFRFTQSTFQAVQKR